MSMADRQAVAALLRVAAADIADAELLHLGARNAWLLLGRAARRLWEAVLVSEHGLSALGPQPLALDGVHDANPLKGRLSEFADLVAGAQRHDGPDRAGRLPEPTDRPPEARVRRLRALLDEAMHAFQVDLEQPDEPAGRKEPLRLPPPVPAASPPSPRVAAPASARQQREAPAILTPRMATRAASPPAPAEPRHETEATPVTSVAFWTLMDRWQVDDLTALALVGHERKLTRKGERPRFRLVGSEAAAFAVLREIDATLTLASQDPGRWLRAGRRGAPLQGQTPLTYMASHGMAGAREIHHLAVQEGLARSML